MGCKGVKASVVMGLQCYVCNTVYFALCDLHLTAESAVKLQVSSSSGKGVASSKGGRAPGSKAKDPIQERKEAQLADEAQVHKLLLYLSHSTLVCMLIS